MPQSAIERYRETQSGESSSEPRDDRKQTGTKLNLLCVIERNTIH